MLKRRISSEEGLLALRTQAREGRDAEHTLVLTAVRFSLEELGVLHPGQAVEVRVPLANAVQILPETTHRRDTPPAVVETSVQVWLSLITGCLSWEDAISDGRIQASGERADLAPFSPYLSL